MPVKKTTISNIRHFGGTYAVIPSSTINLIQNPDSLAMLVWLLDRSEDWVVRREHLRTRFSLGRARYDNAMRELKDLGLAWWHEERDPATGQIIDRVLNVGDVPLESVLPKVGKPTIGETPTVGKSDHLPSTDILPNTDGIRGWQEWVDYRKEIKKKMTPSTVNKQVKFLSGRTAQEQQAIIDQSITNGWTGLFEVNNGNKQSGKQYQGRQTAAGAAQALRDSIARDEAAMASHD